MKLFPKRQTEIVLYPELLDRPEFHPIGKRRAHIYIRVNITITFSYYPYLLTPIQLIGTIASSLTLDHILFLLVENKLVCTSQNPHFYSDIPGEESNIETKSLDFTKCIAEFQKKSRVDIQLHVLCDRKSVIFFKLGENRTFGNIWEVGKAKKEWILKGMCILALRTLCTCFIIIHPRTRY